MIDEIPLIGRYLRRGFNPRHFQRYHLYSGSFGQAYFPFGMSYVDGIPYTSRMAVTSQSHTTRAAENPKPPVNVRVINPIKPQEKREEVKKPVPIYPTPFQPFVCQPAYFIGYTPPWRVYRLCGNPWLGYMFAPVYIPSYATTPEMIMMLLSQPDIIFMPAGMPPFDANVGWAYHAPGMFYPMPSYFTSRAMYKPPWRWNVIKESEGKGVRIDSEWSWIHNSYQDKRIQLFPGKIDDDTFAIELKRGWFGKFFDKLLGPRINRFEKGWDKDPYLARGSFFGRAPRGDYEGIVRGMIDQLVEDVKSTTQQGKDGGHETYVIPIKTVGKGKTMRLSKDKDGLKQVTDVQMEEGTKSIRMERRKNEIVLYALS